jgi:ATP-dependent Clp endopeptidase proteolytic subunit ClpP
MPNVREAVLDYLREHGGENTATEIVAQSPLADRKSVEVRALAGGVEMLVMGEVGFDVTAEGVLAALNEADGADITVRINSPGGSAFDGFAIYNMLSRYEGKVSVVVEAVAASAASIIAMAGDEVVMAPASFMMIHNSMGMTVGNTSDHEATIEVLRRIDQTMANVYADRTGKPVGEIKAMMQAESWLTAEEAVAAGLATRIEKKTPAKARALAEPRAERILYQFANTPAAVLAMSRSPNLPDTDPVQDLIAEVQAVRREISAAAKDPTPARPDNQSAPPASTPQKENKPMSGTAATENQGGAPASAQETPTVTTVHQAPTPTASVVVPVVPVGPIAASLDQLEAIGARANLGSDWVLAQFKAGATEIAARDAALTVLATAHPQRPAIIGSAAPTATIDGLCKSIVASIAAHGRRKEEVSQEIWAQSRPMAGLTLYDMAAEYHEARTGKRSRMPATQLFREVFAMGTVGMQTTSDFPSLLNLGAEAIIIDTAVAVSTAWRKIARTYDFDNFRTRDVAGGFDVPDLQQVQEHEEIRYGAIARTLGKLNLNTFAMGFSFSRQAIINNDLTQFTSNSQAYGALAANSLSKRVWRVFALGTTAAMNMSDGVPFLHANHGNLAGSGAAITETSLIAAEQALSAQAISTGNPLYLSARYLIVGSARKFEARKILASDRLSDNTTNIHQNAYELIENVPGFPDNGWALVADPAQHPVIAVALLGGRETPEVVTEESFDTFGIKLRVSLDYEAAPIDYRGVYYNPGV